MAVPFHGNPVIEAVFNTFQSASNEFDAVFIVAGRDTVFRDDEIAPEILTYPAEYMLQSLGVKLIIHLGQFCADRAGELSLRTVLCTRVVLDA